MDPETNIYPEWDSSNDYSYPDLVSFEDENAASAITDKVTLYADDKLIWGTEPDGTKADTNSSKYVVDKDTTTTTTNKSDSSKTTTTTTKTEASKTDDTPANVSYGDANCDGKVDMSDVVLIMQALSNPNKYGLKGTDKNHLTAEGQSNADCDLSSPGMSTGDALAIQKYLLKKVTSLPIKK